MEVNKLNKDFWRSKTVWSAGGAFVLALLAALGVGVPDWLFVMLGSAGLYGIRDAL